MATVDREPRSRTVEKMTREERNPRDSQRLVEEPFRVFVEAAHERQARALPAWFHRKVARLVRYLCAQQTVHSSQRAVSAETDCSQHERA